MNKLSNQRVKELVNRAQHGDGESLNELFDAFMPFRHGLASKFSNKGVENEDIRQQVDMFFIESVMNYNSAYDNSPIRHITSKTKRDTLDFYRKQLKYSEKVFSSGLFSDITLGVNDDVNDDAIYMKVIIEKELDELERKIIHLYVDEDLTQIEIAKRLGIGRNKVQRTIYGIRERYGDIFGSKRALST